MKKTRLERNTPLPRGGPIRKKKRTAREFARIYGSRERVAWIKSLRCIVPWCNSNSQSENAHVETGGMGRKAVAKYIVPLCNRHHRDLHRMGTDSFEDFYAVMLGRNAERIDALWQVYSVRSRQGRTTQPRKSA